MMKFRSVAGLFALLLLPAVANADPRPFTFTYDLYPEGKGQVEYEQWVTWSTHKEHEAGFDEFTIRHEFEIGITDNFDLSFYVPTWKYEDNAEKHGSKFDTAGVEAIVYLSNPVTDPIGVGLYAEINVGESEIEFEQKLLLQKDIGNWTFAYNLIFETEIEGVFHADEENEIEGILGHSFGISYAATSRFSIGAELVIESIFEDWSHYETTTVYAGPAISYRAGDHFWITLSPLYQLSDVEDESDFNVRMIAGWVF